MSSLSILICTVVGRERVFNDLKSNLEEQIRYCPADSVEVLHECDDCKITTGAKRNLLLQRAAGDYVIWCDDDDEVADHYVSDILNAIKTGPDCVPVDGWYTRDGGGMIKWRMSKDFPNATISEGGEQVFLRPVNHIAAVRRSIALQIGFSDVSNGEDKYYSEGIQPLLKTEVKIPHLLYHYKYSSFNKLYK